jgi:uncharacterized protein (DUF924 family)
MTDKAEIAGPKAVISFWFEELDQKGWFEKNETTDREIARRFGATHLSLAGNVPQIWWESAEAALALIIVFDQFPRNIYRGTPLAFATDGLALREAKAAVDAGLDQLVDQSRRLFFYMPFEHSERMEDQDRSVELFTALEDENYLDYAHKHRKVIAEFGRFPHRNQILGRDSTSEEATYLAEPGAGF